jgi:hypothetical protein
MTAGFSLLDTSFFVTFNLACTNKLKLMCTIDLK